MPYIAAHARVAPCRLFCFAGAMRSRWGPPAAATIQHGQAWWAYLHLMAWNGHFCGTRAVDQCRKLVFLVLGNVIVYLCWRGGAGWIVQTGAPCSVPLQPDTDAFLVGDDARLVFGGASRKHIAYAAVYLSVSCSWVRRWCRRNCSITSSSRSAAAAAVCLSVHLVDPGFRCYLLSLQVLD